MALKFAVRKIDIKRLSVKTRGSLVVKDNLVLDTEVETLYACRIFIHTVPVKKCFQRHNNGKIELWVELDAVKLTETIKKHFKIPRVKKSLNNKMLIGEIIDGSHPNTFQSFLTEMLFGYITY